jgi:hemoglobin
MAYGDQASSYVAAGERHGIAKLVDAFYRHMDELPQAAVIRAMHGPDLRRSREKLTVFLCGWLGGPNHYSETFGPISIPRVHQNFPIGAAERDAWLACMQLAVDEQPWAEDFKTYFMRAIAVPAERVRVAAETRAVRAV